MTGRRGAVAYVQTLALALLAVPYLVDATIRPGWVMVEGYLHLILIISIAGAGLAVAGVAFWAGRN